MIKTYDFIGTVNEENGNLELATNEGHTVLTLALSGTLTLYGPDGAVLRSYEQEEVAVRQREIDREVASLYDGVYGEHFGSAVMQAFMVLAQALEQQLLESVATEGYDTTLKPTIN